MATSRFIASLRAAAHDLQSGGWLVRQPDMDAAAVIWERLWIPFGDVLEGEQLDPARVRSRLDEVPAACAAALQVPGIDDRFSELLRLLPQALAAEGQDQAVRVLGGFGTVVSAVGHGPEVSW